jgi:hypothetical protein
MHDPIERIADEHLIKLAADLQVQLEKGTAMRPVLYLLAEQRKKARAAVVQMTLLEPTDAAGIAVCLRSIHLYDDMISACQALMKRRKDAEHRIHERDREEIEDVILGDDDRALFGLEPKGTDL